MKRTRTFLLTILTLVLPAATLVVSQSQVALGEALRFQRPSHSRQSLREQQVNENFRSPSAQDNQAAEEPKPAKVRRVKVATRTSAAPKLTRVQAVERPAKPIVVPAEVLLSLRELKQDSQLVPASVRRVQHVPDLATEDEPSEVVENSSPMLSPTPMMIEQPGQMIGMPCADCGLYNTGSGNFEPGCGCPEPSCGIAEPGCGMAEPSCGMAEPSCGMAEPSCGMAQSSCGSSVGMPGSDYWCFPVCLPRFKDLSFWGGVHGFRGPRDFYAPGSTVPGSRSASNFGFQEGLGISGRAPFIGLLLPQLSYQLGYQGVHSRFSGTVADTNERTQHFVTAGFFRRVNTGLQFGVVWDLMNDNLYVEDDLHQIRTEISIKSPRGREIGFWSATSTNSIDVLGVTYKTVDQYNFFYRCNFGKSSNARVWVGGTGDNEGIFGAELNTPINDRWSVQSGFNWLITDKNAGLEGVTEESWNIGINLVWHLGRTAQTCYRSPFRPMFSVADNGWMMVDQNGFTTTSN